MLQPNESFTVNLETYRWCLDRFLGHLGQSIVKGDSRRGLQAKTKAGIQGQTDDDDDDDDDDGDV